MHPSTPIVVGGCHRSGTSLLRRILDSHPRIHCGPEVKFLLESRRCLAAGDEAAHLRFLESARSILPDEELFEVLGAAFVEIHERAARNAGKPRWADKAPENAVFLDAWGELLGEEWVFVHVLRDPRDTLASMEEHPFPLSVPGGLDARIDHYRRYAEAADTFRRAHPRRCYRLVYERLVASPEAEVRALTSWLGEDFDPAQLRFGSRPHQPGLEDPKVDATGQVHAESVGRWRSVLAPAAVARIEDRAGELWSELERDAGPGG